MARRRSRRMGTEQWGGERGGEGVAHERDDEVVWGKGRRYADDDCQHDGALLHASTLETFESDELHALERRHLYLRINTQPQRPTRAT